MIDKFNSDISKIWKRYKDREKDGTKRHPLTFPKLKKNKLLFVGINPSFSEKSEEEYKFSNNNFSIKKDIKKEEKARNEYSYYKKFKQISRKIFGNEMEWEHIDLFFIREKSQNDLKRIIYPKNGKFNDFGREQLNLSLNKIKELEPKIIVVANALASNIIKKEWNIKDNDFNKELGFHKVEINDKKIAIFFSGMLSGQRALDKGSFERLIWHIGKAIRRN